jgi:transposase
MLHQTLTKGWCGHGSGLLLGLIVRARGRLVKARSRFAAAENRSPCPAQRPGGPHPGYPRPVAPLEQREGLLALRFLAPAASDERPEGATDAAAFELYIEHFLAPTLCEGQVVVMDNLGAHRPKRIRELIEARGAELVFVPSYSPDLNPIEQAFSKIKNILRKLGGRTHEALLEAMEEALSKVTPADAAGWLDHCGYQVEVQYL